LNTPARYSVWHFHEGCPRVRRFRLTALARCIATVLAVLWCVQPLALVVHARAHAHTYCAAHNAFEETSGGAGATEQAGVADASDGDVAPGRLLWVLGATGAESPSGLPPEAGAHQDCAAAGALSAEVTGPAPVAPLLLPAVPAPALYLADAPGRASVALLRVAPKASPPPLPPSLLG
jgi:hypothetical protein